MSWTSWTSAWMALLCLACGNHGSKPKAHEAGSAGSAAPVAWQFDQFVDAPKHRVAVLFAGSDAALVDGSGRATPAIKVGADPIAATGNGELVVLASGDTAHVLDAAGRQLAAVPTFGGQGVTGGSTFANAGDKGAGVYALSSGKPVYETKAPAKRVRYHAPDGYVFGSESELWFVEEATGKERWHVPIAALGNIELDARSDSMFVTHPDHTFEQLDLAHGKLLAKGTCAGKPSSADDRKHPGCAGYPNVDLAKDDVREPVKGPYGGDYYPYAKHGTETFMVARDPVGRIRWSTPAPVNLNALRGPLTANRDAKVVAFVSGNGDAKRLLVFDDNDGKLLFQRELAGERLVGATGPCWLVVSGKHAACLDVHTGAVTWEVVTSGELVEAWTLHDGEALLADGIPLTLSRIGKDGRRSWQVELPETHLEHASDPDKQGSLWVDSKPWQLSDALGIVEGKDGLTVIDLVTGKLAKVH
jgi:outer membrane protein assembly factor BamB